jgi:NAD(P)-dependent dehydrogenase (short-subunit alcohol dehydrogenase family)
MTTISLVENAYLDLIRARENIKVQRAALEYNNKNIRVNAVCPGMVDTPLTQSFFDSSPKLAAAVQRLMPGGKLGQPTQVAEAVVWLCSEHASWVSGLSMVIDGGYVNR